MAVYKNKVILDRSTRALTIQHTTYIERAIFVRRWLAEAAEIGISSAYDTG
jgi:hypothetical protein